jgi:hypothetical protein
MIVPRPQIPLIGTSEDDCLVELLPFRLVTRRSASGGSSLMGGDERQHDHN